MEEGVIIAEHTAVENPGLKPEQRLKICMSCPLFIRDMQICNPGLWMNPQTEETSHKAKAGFIKGCGCLISRKVRQPKSHCHLGKW